MLNRLKSKSKNIYLYLYEETLLVYSTLSRQLYGFRDDSAALFLFIDENREIDAIYAFVKDSGIEITDEIEETIKMMINLLNGVEKIEMASENIAEEFSDILEKTSSETLRYYEFFDKYFSLNIDNREVSELILDSFEHLRCEKRREALFLSIDVILKENVYEIYVDKKKVRETSEIGHILPTLHDLIRLYYYKQSDFLVAMHSGCLKYNNKMLILPGLSGSGKSTLSAYLMYHNFELYSDELSIITQKHTIVPLPLCLTLKEGSWSVVESFTHKLKKLKKHLRYDGQYIKLLPPISVVRDEHSAEGASIIFPTYIKDAKTDLQKIDLIETMQLLTQTQYHIVDTQDIDKTESWLKLLMSCSIYRLTYSDLEDVEELIKGLMR